MTDISTPTPKANDGAIRTMVEEQIGHPIPPPPAYVKDFQPGLSERQVAALVSPISHHRVSTRSESGKQLSYVQAWDVKATLVKVFGFGGFSAELIDTQVLYVGEKPQSSNPSKMNSVVVARATVRLTIHATGAVYTETATGQNGQPDIGKAYDTAFKSAESDALKRAALYLGTQFGLSLYAATKDNVCWPILEPAQQAMLAGPQAAPDTTDAVAMLERATTVDPNIVAEDAAAEEATLRQDQAEGNQP